MNDWDLRCAISKQFVRGTGFEVGAGLSPSRFSGIDDLLFVDKRNEEEFQQLFGSLPPYKILSLETARQAYPQGLDFVVAHHVLEHCANPIQVMAAEWIPLIR